jgi:hypothetical protein
MKKLAALVLQVAGIAAIAAAGWLVAEPLGVAVLGVGLVLFGVAVERS